MSGDRMSLGASACCCPLGSWLYSSPQCRATTTTSAPRRRATLASVRIRRSSMGFDRQVSPSGAGMPLKPKVYESNATPDPVDIEERRGAGLLWRPGGPGMADAGGVERVEGPRHTLGAPVVGVVGRRRAGVVAGGSQRRGDLRGHGEAGIAREGPAGRGDRRLHVADRHVGPAHHRSDAREHGTEVVAAGVSSGGGVGARLIPQGGVEQDVARGHQRERPRVLGRVPLVCPGYRRRVAVEATGFVGPGNSATTGEDRASPSVPASGSGRTPPRATTSSVAASAAGNAGDRSAMGAGVAGPGRSGARCPAGSVRTR